MPFMELDEEAIKEIRKQLSSAQDRAYALIKNAKVNLVTDQKFFGSLCVHLPEVEDFGRPTAATNSEELFYNPFFISLLGREAPDASSRNTKARAQTLFVVCHEVLHAAFGHCGWYYRLVGPDQETADIACDLKINYILRRNAIGEMPPGCIYADNLPDPRDPTDEKKKLQIDDLTAEDIYRVLKALPKQRWPDGLKPKGKGAPCLMMSPSPAAAQKIADRWKGRVAAAAANCKGHGHLPYGMAEMIKDLLEPKLGWRHLLPLVLAETSRDDYDLVRPDRRYVRPEATYCIPDLHSERGKVMFGIDTSGSMDKKQIMAGLTEAQSICQDMAARMYLVTLDAGLQDQVWVENSDVLESLNFEVHGRGGTDWQPVIDEWDRLQPTEQFSALVIFTDGECSWPEPPKCASGQIIWVVDSPVVKDAPFGITVPYGD